MIVRLTSDELATEGNRVVNSEASLSTHCKAVLLLIKADVANLLRATWFRHCHDNDLID